VLFRSEEGAEYKSEGHLAKRPAPPAVGTNQDQYTAVRALDPTTGQAKWEFKLDAGPDLSTFHDYKADHGAAGILTTASDLLFTGGRQGTFVALDARNGELLWKQQLGGSLLMNPMTYAVHGKQYIAVAAGTSLFVFGLQ
jgi:alcohol dehydrogenase (cytochrome c)